MRGWEISGCSNQIGREKKELKLRVMGRRTWTVKHREPHCSCRVVIVILIQWLLVCKWLKKTYYIELFSPKTKFNFILTFLHTRPLSSLPLLAPKFLPFSLPTFFDPHIAFSMTSISCSDTPLSRQTPSFHCLPTNHSCFTSQTADTAVENPQTWLPGLLVCAVPSRRGLPWLPQPWLTCRRFPHSLGCLLPISNSSYLSHTLSPSVSTLFLQGHSFLFETQLPKHPSH